jgi:hypothetical protein
VAIFAIIVAIMSVIIGTPQDSKGNNDDDASGLSDEAIDQPRPVDATTLGTDPLKLLDLLGDTATDANYEEFLGAYREITGSLLESGVTPIRFTATSDGLNVEIAENETSARDDAQKITQDVLGDEIDVRVSGGAIHSEATSAVPGGGGLRAKTTYDCCLILKVCTKGWTVSETFLNYTNWYLLTAGHCMKDDINFAFEQSDPLKHCTSGSCSTTNFHSPTFPYSFNTFFGHGEDVNSDAVLLYTGSQTTGSRPLAAREVRPKTIGGSLQAIVDVFNTTVFPNGSELCGYGFSTTDGCGFWFGWATEVYGTIDPVHPHFVHYQMVIAQESSQLICTGDSGGPVYGQYFPGGVSAMGMISSRSLDPDHTVGDECSTVYYASALPYVLADIPGNEQIALVN